MFSSPMLAVAAIAETSLGFMGQTFAAHDVVTIGLLVLLEGVLSIDNALVLGLLAKRLPKHQQQRALTYGLVGAFAFRLIAVGMASQLLKWNIVKLLGGGYLVYIAIKHLFFEAQEEEDQKLILDEAGQPVLVDAAGGPLRPEQESLEIEERVPVDLAAPEQANVRAETATSAQPAPAGGYSRFWPTVLTIELTDIAFAVDSILAAMAFIPAMPKDSPVSAVNPKLWVVYTGGMFGVILMRFAAAVFIKLLEKFPRFELSAYLLVTVIGLKLLIDWGFNTPENPHRIDFHSTSHAEFWIFWGAMLVCFCVGFLRPRERASLAHES